MNEFHRCQADAYGYIGQCAEQTRTTVNGYWLCAFHRYSAVTRIADDQRADVGARIQLELANGQEDH